MKSYFSFSKSQKIGVVSIAIIIVGLIILLNKESRIGIPDPFVVDASQYEMIDDGNDYSTYDKQKSKQKSDKQNYTLTQFNPNKYKEEDWEKIGFSNKQAKSIVSFKNKLGGFKHKEDLKKSFVINDEKYKELEPFIQMKPENNNKVSESTKEQDLQPEIMELVELNSATQQELVDVKGIGDFTAKKIIEYKNKLGGFHSKKQLKEVYGISPENYELILPQIEINTENLKMINVNQASISELKKHPYISWTIAKSIIDQKFKGKLTNLDFLEIQNLMTHSELENLLPYIQY